MTTGEKFQKIVDRCKGSVNVNVNDHTTSYMSLEQYFRTALYLEEECDIKRCVLAGSVCEISAYTESPVGCMCVCAPTFEMAVNELFDVLGLGRGASCTNT